MKNGLLLKRQIKHGLCGFAAIAVSVMLCTCFLTGWLVSVPSLRHTADSFYDSQNLWDINIKSDLGFTYEDIRAVMGEESVQKATGAVSLEVSSAVNGGGNYATRLYGIDFDTLQMNSASLLAAPMFISGSAPINNHSCVAVVSAGLKSDINIGDKITVSGNTGICRETVFTVTGIMISPLYTSGNADISDNGTPVQLVLYVPNDVFLTDGTYTDIYVTVEGAKDISALRQKYSELVDNSVAKITEIGTQRAAIRSESLETENLSDIEKAQKQYDFIKSDTDSQLKETKNTIDKLKKEIDTASQQIAEKEKSVAAAKAALDALSAEMAAISAKGDLASAAELAALQKYNDDLAEYNTAVTELQDLKTTYEMNNNTYKSLQKDYEVYKKLADEKLATAQQNLDNAKNGVLTDYTQNWYITTREDNVSFADFKANSGKINATLAVLAVAFLIIAALVVYTVISKMLENGRTDDALLKTLGYSFTALTNRYSGFALTAGIIGGILGVAAGYAAVPVLVFKAYSLFYVFPDFKLSVMPWVVIVSAAAVLVLTLPVTVYLCKKRFKGDVSGLGYTEKKTAGKHVFLEKYGKIWAKLPVLWRAAVRNVLTDKKGLTLNLIGIAGGAALLLTGLGISSTAVNTVNKQYSKIQNYQVEISLVDGTDYTASQDFTAYLTSPDKVTDYLRVYRENCKITLNGTDQNILVTVPLDTEKFGSFVTLRTSALKSKIDFNDTSVAVTKGFAKENDIKKGDAVTLINSSGVSLQFTVTGICENYVGNYIYINPQKYAEVCRSAPTVNALYVKSEQSTHENETEEKLLSLGVAGSVDFNYDKINSILGSTQNTDYLAAAFLAAAVLTLLAVVYNISATDIKKRAGEIGAVMSTGISGAGTALYLYRETVIVTVTGTVIGLIAGTLLYRILVVTANMQNIIFVSGIGFSAYLITVLATFLLTFIVNFIALIKKR